MSDDTLDDAFEKVSSSAIMIPFTNLWPRSAYRGCLMVDDV